jgi:hypothetical protein
MELRTDLPPRHLFAQKQPGDSARLSWWDVEPTFDLEGVLYAELHVSARERRFWMSAAGTESVDERRATCWAATTHRDPFL